MIKFFLDVNIPYAALEVFKEFHLEALHARDVGLSRSDDQEIMEYAIKNKCILITKDMEFANIKLFPPMRHHGMIIMRLPSFFKASQCNEVLKRFLSAVNKEDLEKFLAIVKVGRYRIRKFV